jgi:hypothetical protein
MADLSPSDLDIMARTMIGEDPTPDGQAAVAHVMLNRLQSGQYGDSMTGIALAPNQFEPWSSRAGELVGISPASASYRRAYEIARSAYNGETPDETGGATHFINKKLQTSMGRNVPSWAQGTPIAQVGAHSYYAPQGRVTSKPMADPFQEFKTEDAPQSAAPVIAPSGNSGDPFQEFSTIAPDSEIGANGLIWDKNGGRDPKTGELVIAGKPFTSPVASRAVAATTPILEGVPIVGPALRSGIEKAAAAYGALRGDPYDQSVKAYHDIVNASESEYPKTTTAANVIGGVLGTLPAVAAVPELFGISKAPMVVNALASGASGAAIGGTDAAVRSGNYDYHLGSPAANGAILGGAFGAAAPFAGQIIGSGLNAATNLLTRTTPAARNVASVLEAAGLTSSDARSALTRMGPQATLADIDPALTTEAAGLARMGGGPTSILKGAMATRAAGADDRVAQAIESSIGARPDLTAAQGAIEDQASRAASPHYTAARANPTPMNVNPIISDIDARANNAVGGTASVLDRAKSYLFDRSGVPKTDPDALLNVRQQLDADIEQMKRNGALGDTSAGATAINTAKDIRSKIDGVLKSDPNIAAGDAAYAKQMKINNAVDEGTKLFEKGTRLPDFQRSLAGKTTDEVNGLKTGALSAVWDALDNARRGNLSGAQSMFGKSSANRAKLDALFPNSGDVFDMLHGEAAMRATEQRVAQNSITAEAQAVQNKYNPRAEPGIGAAAPIVGEALGGGPGAAAATGMRMVYGHLRNTLLENSLNRLSEGTARGLSATGPAQSAFLNQLERAARTSRSSALIGGGGSALTNLLTRTAPQTYNALSSSQ